MFEFSPYAGLPALSALVTAALAAYTYRRRRVPAAWMLFRLMAVMCAWALLFALNLCATGLDVKVFLWNLGAVCAQLVGLFVFAFAMEVTGNGERLTRGGLMLLWIVPAAVAVLAFSAGSHRLFGYDFAIVRESGAAFLAWKRGPVFVVHYFYIVLMLLVSTVFYTAGLFRATVRERTRFALMIGVTLPPLAVELFAISPVRGLSIVHSTFWLLGAGYAIAIFKYGLIDLVPVARERLFEEMVDPVLILDVEGRIAGANRSARGTFALPASCIGMDVSETLFGKDSISRAIEDTGFRLQDGEMAVEAAGRFWHVTVTRVRDEGTRKEGRLVVLRDVTELKLAGERLRQALDETRKMSEAKSRFVSVMSHELRTPLHAMAGSADLLSETALDERQRRLVDLSARSCATLKGLIDDAMDRSLIEAGRMTLAREPVFIRPLLDDLREMFSEQFDDKGLEFSVAVSPEVPADFESDGKRLFQVFTNLVGNALKYTERGRVGVEVRLANGDGSWIEASVSDTGRGIEPGRIGGVFEPFSKVAGGGGTAHGIGLGLSITRDIVAMMGGRIEARSEPGRGSTFTVRLPLVETGACPDFAPGTAAEGLPADLKILAVDDVPENMEIIRLYLEGSAAEVREAADGREALRLFETERFDCVLLDMQLPVVDGVEVAKTISAAGTKNGRRTPVIAISADASPARAAEAVAAGCDAYLVRPVSKADLISAVSKAVRGEPPGACRRTAATAESPPVPAGAAEERCREYAAGVMDAVKAGDWDSARRLGHSIKGLGMTFSLVHAERLGAAIEDAAAGRDGNACAALARRFTAE